MVIQFVRGAKRLFEVEPPSSEQIISAIVDWQLNFIC